MAHFVQRVLEVNALTGTHYAEPYAGGAGVALALLASGAAAHVHINDVDRSVYAFWHSVLNSTDAFCEKLQEVPLSIEQWDQQRAVQSRKSDAPLCELGFSTFYLNRTNRSGIIASGGAIGGRLQEGEWGIDARFNRAALEERVRWIASRRDAISVTNLDAIDFLRHLEQFGDDVSLVYLDPPYYVKGRRRLYASFYRDDDHAAVAEAVAALPFSWIVSYDAAPEIMELYCAWRKRTYDLSYSAARRESGVEVMFFSPDLNIPRAVPLVG